MINKLLKISVLFLFLNTVSFSQTHPVNQSPKDIVSQFNDYLKSVKLNQVFHAADYACQKEVSFTGAMGTVNLSGVNVLTLEPDSAFSNPLEFAALWKKVLQQIKGKNNIYWQQFFRLTDLTQLPARSLVIELKTNNPDVFSYMVSFDGKIRVNEQTRELKGSSAVPIHINPDDDFPFDGYFQNAPYTKALHDKLINGISMFLKLDYNGKPDKHAVVIRNNYTDSYVLFKATNLSGRITRKYHDIIKLYISIAPSSDKKKADIGYNFSVHFGTGPYSSNLKNYEDATKRYTLQMAKFGEDLKRFIQKIIDEKPKY